MLSRTADHLYAMARYMERAGQRAPGAGRAEQAPEHNRQERRAEGQDRFHKRPMKMSKDR